jgi:hypothetical protein
LQRFLIDSDQFSALIKGENVINFFDKDISDKNKFKVDIISK